MITVIAADITLHIFPESQAEILALERWAQVRRNEKLGHKKLKGYRMIAWFVVMDLEDIQEFKVTGKLPYQKTLDLVRASPRKKEKKRK